MELFQWIESLNKIELLQFFTTIGQTVIAIAALISIFVSLKIAKNNPKILVSSSITRYKDGSHPCISIAITNCGLITERIAGIGFKAFLSNKNIIVDWDQFKNIGQRFKNDRYIELQPGGDIILEIDHMVFLQYYIKFGISINSIFRTNMFIVRMIIYFSNIIVLIPRAGKTMKFSISKDIRKHLLGSSSLVQSK